MKNMFVAFAKGGTLFEAIKINYESFRLNGKGILLSMLTTKHLNLWNQSGRAYPRVGELNRK